MAKFLLVGDVHATPDDLDDCRKLIDGIVNVLIDETLPTIDYVVFMGDQAHNHAVLNVYVLNFWKEAFLRIRPLVKDIICLIGNHDLPGNTGVTNINSMSTLEPLCMALDGSMEIEGTLFVGYKHNHQDFIKVCEQSNSDVVICHQTFQGATYENGFWAKDGIDLEELPKHQSYISGHIHTPQSFGRVKYVGAPRWRTLADADVIERWLHIYDSETGELIQTIPTSQMVRRKTKITLQAPQQFDILKVLGYKPGDIVFLDLIGPLEWINKHKSVGKMLNAIVKTFPTDTKPVKVKESEGIDKALIKYLDSTATTTPKDVLKKLIEERLWNQG